MQAIAMAGKPVLRPGDAPEPRVGRDQLLVQVHAAGVTPTELLWYPTTHTRDGGIRTLAVPGHEFSGVVVDFSDGVEGYEKGDAIFGMNDWFDDGALAEFCVAPFGAVAKKPAVLTHVEAASVPIGALTAMQGLFTRAKLLEGERVLVHGGSGAVGAFAVQLAKLRGAHVVATCSRRNIDFVAALGADQVLSYENSPFEDSARDFDVVFDTVGGETLRRSWGVLKPAGRMVTIVESTEVTTDELLKKAFFIVEPNGQQLTEIANMLVAGKLQTTVDAVFPFAQAPDVFAERVVRRGRGKMVVETVQPGENLNE